MSAEYYVINKDTNKVEFIDKDGEIAINVKYPNKILVPVNNDDDVPNAFAGCLYQDGLFWAPLIKTVQEQYVSDFMSYRNVREMFSEDELNKFDSFETDTGISEEVRSKLRTMFKSLEVAGRVKKTDKIYANAAAYLHSIGYMTDERYDSVKDILGEPDEI